MLFFKVDKIFMILWGMLFLEGIGVLRGILVDLALRLL